jgi:hypothetical protein
MGNFIGQDGHNPLAPSMVTAPARGTPALDVTLYWFALRETATNYKAFVHLVNGEGAVVGQHDGDPGAGFTPTTRWMPGELVADRHRISLPPDLPAGVYALKAGLYEPDTVRNLTADPPAPDNRVDLGSVEIP